MTFVESLSHWIWISWDFCTSIQCFKQYRHYSSQARNEIWNHQYPLSTFLSIILIVSFVNSTKNNLSNYTASTSDVFRHCFRGRFFIIYFSTAASQIDDLSVNRVLVCNDEKSAISSTEVNSKQLGSIGSERHDSLWTVVDLSTTRTFRIWSSLLCTSST